MLSFMWWAGCVPQAALPPPTSASLRSDQLLAETTANDQVLYVACFTRQHKAAPVDLVLPPAKVRYELADLKTCQVDNPFLHG
jgi:hypothetical protein